MIYFFLLFALYMLLLFPQCGINIGILFYSILCHVMSRKEFLTGVPAGIEAACGQLHYAGDGHQGLHRTRGLCDGAVHRARRLPHWSQDFTACERLFASLGNQSRFTSGPCSFTFLLRLRVVSVLFERRVGRVGRLLVQLVLGTVA